MCFLSPIRNDPKKTHKQIFGTHPVWGQSCKFVYVYVFFLSLRMFLVFLSVFLVFLKDFKGSSERDVSLSSVGHNKGKEDQRGGSFIYPWRAFRPRKNIFSPPPPNSLQIPSRPSRPLLGDPPPLLGFSVKPDPCRPRTSPSPPRSRNK